LSAPKNKDFQRQPVPGCLFLCAGAENPGQLPGAAVSGGSSAKNCPPQNIAAHGGVEQEKQEGNPIQVAFFLFNRGYLKTRRRP
jgi:hypothetical protein